MLDIKKLSYKKHLNNKLKQKYIYKNTLTH
jgi:hypothetical protein